MKALTYTKPGRFELIEKPKPEILNPKDAVVRVTLSSICSSDLHILHGARLDLGDLRTDRLNDTN